MVEMVDIRDHIAIPPPPANGQIPSFPSAPNPEKNTLSEVEMNMSTPIDEVMDTPMGMMQPQMPQQPQMIDAREVVEQHPAPPRGRAPISRPSKKYPLNLNEDQVQALIAGVAGVAAFSRPIQERLLSMLPQALSPEGGLSPIGMALTAFIAAVIFYILKRSV